MAEYVSNRKREIQKQDRISYLRESADVVANAYRAAKRNSGKLFLAAFTAATPFGLGGCSKEAEQPAVPEAPLSAHEIVINNANEVAAGYIAKDINSVAGDAYRKEVADGRIQYSSPVDMCGKRYLFVFRDGEKLGHFNLFGDKIATVDMGTWGYKRFWLAYRASQAGTKVSEALEKAKQSAKGVDEALGKGEGGVTDPWSGRNKKE